MWLLLTAVKSYLRLHDHVHGYARYLSYYICYLSKFHYLLDFLNIFVARIQSKSYGYLKIIIEHVEGWNKYYTVLYYFMLYDYRLKSLNWLLNFCKNSSSFFLISELFGDLMIVEEPLDN